MRKLDLAELFYGNQRLQGVLPLKAILRNSRFGRRMAQGAVRDYLYAQLVQFRASGCRICLPVGARTPELTVIVLVDERLELTVNCLKALCMGDLRSAELTCVATRFSTTTRSVLSQFAGLTCLEFRGQTPIDAVNRAVAAARGEYVLLLRNNLEAAPNALTYTLQTGNLLPESVGVIGGITINAQGTIFEAGSFISEGKAIVRCGSGDEPSMPEYQYRRSVPLFVNTPLLTRRALLLDIGGLDSAFEAYALSDYCLRVRQEGLEVIYDPRISAVDVQMHAEYQSSFADRVAKDELHSLLRKHRRQLVDDTSSLVVGHSLFENRSSPRPRILFVEDRVPHPNLGRGYPRSHLILEKLVEFGNFVTLYPVMDAHEEWSSAYRDIPRDVEIMLGHKRKRLAQFLGDRAGFYDLILVSRPSNMKRFRKALGKALPPIEWSNLQVIYDAEALNCKRDIARMSLEGQPPTRLQVECLISDETKLADGCHAVIAVSDAEGAEFSRRGIANVYTLGHAICLSPTPNTWKQREGLLFVGALPTRDCPNAEGLTWFCSEVLPLLQERLGRRVQVLVVGKNSLSRDGALANDSVVFAGEVNDLEPLYNRARLFIAPVRFAAGIPLKIYEAAANGVPVVSTALLAEQLRWQHKRELLVARSAEEFARECERLYEDADLWDSIRSRALERVGTDASMESFSMKLKSIVDSAIASSRARWVMRRRAVEPRFP